MSVSDEKAVESYGDRAVDVKGRFASASISNTMTILEQTHSYHYHLH